MLTDALGKPVRFIIDTILEMIDNYYSNNASRFERPQAENSWMSHTFAGSYFIPVGCFTLWTPSG